MASEQSLGIAVLGYRAEDSGFTSTTDKAADSVDNLSDRQERLAQIAKEVGPAIASAGRAIVTAGAAAAGAFVLAAKNASDFATEVRNSSRQVGISAEELQLLGRVYEDLGFEVEDARDLFGTLSERIVEQSEFLNVLGVSTRDASGNIRNSRDVLLDVAEAYQNSNDQTATAANIISLLGDSASRILPFLQEHGREIFNVAGAYREFGIVSNESIESNANLRTSFGNVSQALRAFQGNVIAAASPELMESLDDLARTITGLTEPAIEALVELIPKVSAALEFVVENVELVSVAFGALFLSGPILNGINLITQSVTGLRIAFSILNTTMRANPALFIAGAVFTGGVALLTWLNSAKEDTEALDESVNNLSSEVTTLATETRKLSALEEIGGGVDTERIDDATESISLLTLALRDNRTEREHFGSLADAADTTQVDQIQTGISEADRFARAEAARIASLNSQPEEELLFTGTTRARNESERSATLNEAQLAARDAGTAEAAARENAEALKLEMEAADDAAQANERLAQERQAAVDTLDMQFQSSIADAFTSFVSGAQSASEAMQQLISNIIAAIAQQLILNAVSAAFGGATGGLASVVLGGARRNGGPVSAGLGYQVNEGSREIFIPNQPGRVEPITAGDMVTNVTNNQSFNITGSDEETVQRVLTQASPIIRQETTAATFQALNRPGPVRRALR